MDLSGKNVKTELETLKRLINKELSNLEKAHPALGEADETIYNAMKMKQIATALRTCNSEQIQSRVRSITITIQPGGMEEEVLLNPKLSLIENAALFEKKAGKLLQKSELKKKGEEDYSKKYELLRASLNRLKQISPDQFRNQDMISLIAEIQKSILIQPEKSDSIVIRPSTSYRYFVWNGWEIFAGKTDEQNDELSTRFTGQRDLWFHAAHCPGSHVVLKCPTHSPRPGQDIIEKAALVAAWFSKSRNAPSVEVHHTEGRFVHKRRNAPKGEVILEKFSTIRVRPRNPDELFI